MLFLFGFVYPGRIVGFQFDDAEMVGPFPFDSSAQGGGQFGAAALLFGDVFGGIEKFRLLRFRIRFLEFPADSLIQQATEKSGMLGTDHDTASARDAFLFVGLVGFLHSDGSDRAHFHTGMAGCTFSLTPFWMQRNRLGITIMAFFL